MNTLQDNIDLNTTNILTKQATITEGSLSIDKTSGLQTALNLKQANITTSTCLSLDILTAKNIITQNTITDGSLTINRTTGLQTALNAKQATITTSTSLSLDILTAKNINRKILREN